MRWREATLGELAERDSGLVQTGPFGSQLHQSDYLPDGIPVIMPKDIEEGRVSVESVARVSEETVNRLQRHKLKPRSIVLPRRGEVTKRAFIRAEQEGWLCGTGCLKIELGGRELVPEYLYYFMEQDQVVQWLEQHAVGTTMLNLSAGIVADLPIRYPGVDAQNAIASTLTAYDELMENNRRRMGLLDEAARLLYREWFVRLHFPGHEHAHLTHGLPEGWERKTLIEVCGSLEDGDWIESKDQGGEDYRLLQISNIGMNDFIETGNYRFISQETFRRLNCREVKPDDLLISRMPTPIGRAWLVTEMPWKMVTAVDAAILTTDDTVADRYFLLYHLNSPSSIEHCERRAVGATRPRVARRELAGIPVLLPPGSLQREFREIVKPINEQRTNLYRQNQKLRAARDLLLPRLMSGEIAV